MQDSKQHFSDVALIGPALFFQSAFSDEEMASKFSHLLPETARDFWVLRTLAELQKYGFASRSWLSASEPVPQSENLKKLHAESLVVEQAAWHRRLLEALIILINFSTTNDNPYFFHFILLKEFEKQRQLGRDEKDFFGTESDLTRANILAAKERVDRSRKPLVREIWYLNPRDPYRSNSFRNMFLRAIRLARSSEKAALGYTYQLLFGAASESLHFSIQRPHETPNLDENAFSLPCGLIIYSILCRVHDLCGVTPIGVNKTLMEGKFRDRPISDLLSKRAEIGDFVITGDPNLAEVLEIKTNAFGYESYRILFLESGEEAWLPAPAIVLYESRRTMVQRIRENLSKYDEAPDVSDDDILQAARNASLKVWNRVARDYYVKKMEGMKNKKT